MRIAVATLLAVCLIPAGPAHADTVTVHLRQAVRDLPVAARTHAATYDRERGFGDWTGQGNGCDTRAVVLVDESTRQTIRNENCTILTGRWTSLYDGRVYRRAEKLQVDHVVPVENAWVSGAWAWSKSKRVAYYNDLGDDRSLVAVDVHDNEAKGDSSPDEWMPAKGRCAYVADYVVVKVRWGLSVTAAEQGALGRFAARCADVVLTVERVD